MYSLKKWTLKEFDRFDKMLNWLDILEGRLSNNSNDWGGLTMRGITQVVYDEYRIDLDLDTRSVTEITEDEVRDIYRIGYAVPSRIMRMESPLDFVRFQASVNFGPSRDIKMLQFAMGYEYYKSGMKKDPAKKYADGRIGPKTTKDIGCLYTAEELSKLYLDQQIKRYKFIVERSNKRMKLIDPEKEYRDQRAFVLGWLRRVSKTASLIGLDYTIPGNIVEFATKQNQEFKEVA